jgi:cytosine permease
MSVREEGVHESFQHDHALERVPEKDRRGLYATAMVWAGWVISISAFLTGGVVGAGLTAAEGLAAVFLGNAVLAAIAVLVGLVGYRNGLSSYLIARVLFGRQGSMLASLIIGILAMGFIGVLLDGFGKTLNALLPFVPYWLAIVVFAGMVTATAIFGFRGLAALSVVAGPLLWLLLLWGLLTAIAMIGGIDKVFAAPAQKPISFGVAIGAVIATWITGAAICSDITRYARKGWHVVVGAAVGYVLGAGIFEGAAVLTFIGAKEANVVSLMAKLGLLAPGVVLFALALWTTTDNNLYSSALAFTNFGNLVGLKLSKPAWTIVGIAIALITAGFGLATQFLSWLQIIATVTPPFAGLIIAHYYLLGHIRKSPSEIMASVPDGWRWTAYAAWALGSLVGYYTNFVNRIGIAPIQALVVAGIAYWILSLAFERQPERVAERGS